MYSINKEASTGAGRTSTRGNMAAILLNLHTLETLDEPTVKWTVPMSDGNHVIEFEHGTATGRRVVKLDGKELIHRDWMFHLVGDEVFTYNDNKFVIRVDPIPGLKYSYTLWVNGKSYTNFVKSQSKILESWLANVGNEEYRIVLDKQQQSVWVNGEQIDTEVRAISWTHTDIVPYEKNERFYRQRRGDTFLDRRTSSHDQILQFGPEGHWNNILFVHQRRRDREGVIAERIRGLLKQKSRKV
ncbi:fas apoptotic inhibitory molecule 1 isoform X2 [Ptiloglossa arizonensis]|uniref:fas apoptotic inhibitory molecule 1 isoform X2 n=1 Tax=Ptiloglossa arizonensis TaxID=3350558 RepID=UPI003F9F5D83